MRRNVEKGSAFSMVVPASLFEMTSDAWEEPDEQEISENRIEIITKALSTTTISVKADMNTESDVVRLLMGGDLFLHAKTA